MESGSPHRRRLSTFQDVVRLYGVRCTAVWTRQFRTPSPVYSPNRGSPVWGDSFRNTPIRFIRYESDKEETSKPITKKIPPTKPPRHKGSPRRGRPTVPHDSTRYVKYVQYWLS